MSVYKKKFSIFFNNQVYLKFITGMSTAHEAIVASYCGLKVLAFSIITDKVCLEYDVEEYPDHHEIVKVANEKAKDAEKLIELFLAKINEDKSILS